MSNELLGEYKAYYAVRAEKYANNSKYANSYAAEKNLSDAMQSCSVLEEFKDKIGDLNEKCAVALVKDESLIEQEHYTKHQEIVRAKASEEIISKVDGCATAMDVATLVTEETNKNSIQVSMDEAHREFWYDWKQIDEIRIYENAVVPDGYKQDMQSSVDNIKKSIIEGIEFAEKNNHEWQAAWQVIPEKNMEYRHKRLIPYKDEHIQEQIAKYKSIVNR